MVGGAPVSHAWADEIGADGYGEDAIAAVDAGAGAARPRRAGDDEARPQLLDPALLDRIVGEAFALLMETRRAGADAAVARELLARPAAPPSPTAWRGSPSRHPRRRSPPRRADFYLHDRAGAARGGVRRRSRCSSIPALPASMSSTPTTLSTARRARRDLVRLVQVTELLRRLRGAIHGGGLRRRSEPRSADLYRLFLVLWYSEQAGGDRRVHAGSPPG